MNSISKCGNPSCDRMATVKFCSRSCSAVVNNRLYPKREKSPKTCLRCPSPVATKRGTLCLFHLNGGDKPVTYHALRVLVGAISREIYFNVYPHRCCICGYSSIVQVDHIIPRTQFEDPWDSVFLENLAGLCPNHHFEKTYNLLSVCSVRKSMEGMERLELSCDPITLSPA